MVEALQFPTEISEDDKTVANYLKEAHNSFRTGFYPGEPRVLLALVLSKKKQTESKHRLVQPLYCYYPLFRSLDLVLDQFLLSRD